MVRTQQKPKFSDASQGPPLQTDLSKNSSLRPVINSFLHKSTERDLFEVKQNMSQQTKQRLSRLHELVQFTCSEALR